MAGGAGMAGAAEVGGMAAADAAGMAADVAGMVTIDLKSESPGLASRAETTERTRDDRLRQPIFLGIREDKNANEVVREKAS